MKVWVSQKQRVRATKRRKTPKKSTRATKRRNQEEEKGNKTIIKSETKSMTEAWWKQLRMNVASQSDGVGYVHCSFCLAEIERLGKELKDGRADMKRLTTLLNAEIEKWQAIAKDRHEQITELQIKNEQLKRSYGPDASNAIG